MFENPDEQTVVKDAVVVPVEKEQSPKMGVRPWLWGSVAILVVLVIIGGVWYMTEKSLPGSALYSLKTGSLEDIYVVTRRSGEEKARYQSRLLERRLEELKMMHGAEATEADALTVFADTIVGNNQDFTQYLAVAKSEGLPSKDVLILANDFASHLLAIEMLAEGDEKFSSISETVEDVGNDAENLFEDEAEVFAETEGPRVLTEYLTEVLAAVGETVGKGYLPRAAQEDIENTISSATDALARGNLLRAFKLSGEASRVAIAGELLQGVTLKKDSVVKPREKIGTTTDMEDEKIPTSSLETAPQQSIE